MKTLQDLLVGDDVAMCAGTYVSHYHIYECDEISITVGSQTSTATFLRSTGAEVNRHTRDQVPGFDRTLRVWTPEDTAISVAQGDLSSAVSYLRNALDRGRCRDLETLKRATLLVQQATSEIAPSTGNQARK